MAREVIETFLISFLCKSRRILYEKWEKPEACVHYEAL